MVKKFYLSIQPTLLKSVINCSSNNDVRLSLSVIHNLKLWDYHLCNNHIPIHLTQSSRRASVYSRHPEERITMGGDMDMKERGRSNFPRGPYARTSTCHSAQFFKTKMKPGPWQLLNVFQNLIASPRYNRRHLISNWD